MAVIHVRRLLFATCVLVGGLLWAPAPAEAYVGPGAGFAFVSSLFILLATMVLAVVTLLTWPIRLAVQKVRGNRALAASRVKRVIVLGLDGQDPELTEQLMDEGVLPNFARLRQQGSFHRLRTTLLAESPVAWTSFQTGCNPGKHRIFDFLVPNRKSHLPELCSARVAPPKRSLPLGPFRIPLGKPLIEAGRRSQPFWKILGDHGIVSSILRVPITFPAEKFNGTLLSAMSVPDLNGSQGTYYYFSSDSAEQLSLTSGVRVPLDWTDGVARGVFTGPENSLRTGGGELQLPFEVHAGSNGNAELRLDGVVHRLTRREYTPWITLDFKPGLAMTVTGIVRFYLLETAPHLKLYMTPINIDPDRPALPISHPFTYAIYLSKTQGRYSTLGLCEDTSALNEEVIDEDAFLKQTYLIHEERERMFFDALDKTSRGAVVCVFDITDRLQHMFFRHLDERHPANRGRNAKHKDVIRKLYIEMDALVGRTMEAVDDETTLLVMSDHGFKPFRRGVNLNTWLYQHGLLAVKGDRPTGADMFGDVDWSRTKAYAVGFGGIYLNLQGRETGGIVTPGDEAEQVRREIRDGLRTLVDEVEEVQPVREVYDARQVYSGPYVADAPDLIVGFRPGHRVGWASVTGGISDEVIEDNTRYWSGDHNFNPPDVPGMLFSNRPIACDSPGIMDIGPTVLDTVWCRHPALLRWAVADAGREGRRRYLEARHRGGKGGGAVRLHPRLRGAGGAYLALFTITTVTTVTLGAAGCGGGADGKRVIVLGIDGMDYGMLERFIGEGRLPNFARLAREGDFSPLQTTMPPLSPVAWSTFITGMDPGGHGVFDFLQRDPETMQPVEPFYVIGPEGRSLDLGSWVLPLSGGDLELYRRGQAAWELLDAAGIETTVFRMPVNFPPVDTGGRSFAGMGTPDIIGGHGTYSFFTDYPPDDMASMTGRIEIVEVINDRVEAQLHGPPHPFKREPVNTGGFSGTGEVEYESPDLVVDFEVLLDPDAPVAKIVVQDTELVLNQGEWSDWVPVDFEAIPFVASVSSMARFYLQEVRPDFKLYVSPLQINPEDPAMPLSNPDGWAADLHDVLGPFYTQELPEDTKAFSEGVFSGREFWDQSQFVFGERRRALDYFLDTFDEGLLFFYFSSVDQGSHMLYHYADTEHPLHEPDELLRNGIRTLYEEMDEALGRVLEVVDDDTTLIVMSDHGFAPFYWGVNLNTWLLEQGYVTLKDPSLQGRYPLFVNVDWSRTRAYAFGLGGLYVNLRGRERDGIVEPGAEHEQLLDDLERDLLAMVDEGTGANPVSLVYQTAEQFSGPYLDQGPDIIVGYSRGYRSSWENPLGEFPAEIIVENDDPWSGDHQNDYRLVPGVLLTNQQITLDEPALYDLTVAVLDEFGVAPLPEMIGEDTIGPR